jgi:hypothetical protein
VKDRTTTEEKGSAVIEERGNEMARSAKYGLSSRKNNPAAEFLGQIDHGMKHFTRHIEVVKEVPIPFCGEVAGIKQHFGAYRARINVEYT